MSLATFCFRLRSLLVALALLAICSCRDKDKQGAAPTSTVVQPAPMPAPEMPSVPPADLATRLAAGEKPLLVHVGYKKLYEQAHIPGSEFLGPGSDGEVLAKLRERLADLPRTTELIIYCGCCPWEHCPNVEPAYALVRDLGFTNAKVLYIPKDLGTDWVAKGYPVAKGE